MGCCFCAWRGGGEWLIREGVRRDEELMMCVWAAVERRRGEGCAWSEKMLMRGRKKGLNVRAVRGEEEGRGCAWDAALREGEGLKL